MNAKLLFIKLLALCLIFSHSVYAQAKVKSNAKKATITATKDDPKAKKATITATKDDPKSNKKATITATKDDPKAKVEVNKVEDKISTVETPKVMRVRARGIGRLADRDSGFRPRQGSWSIGLFNPLKIQVSDSWGIETFPVVSMLIAPHLKLWHQWWSNRRMNLQGMYGFSTPSWSLQKGIPLGLAGYLSPSCTVLDEEPNRAPNSCQRPGFDFVPQLGAKLSGAQHEGIWTIEADLAVGLMINGERTTPLDSYAPVELAYAPSTNLYRAHLGFKYAHLIHRRLSLNLGADLYVTGQADEAITPPKSPISVSSQLGLDWALTSHVSMTLGAVMWLSDQRAFELIEDEQGYVQKESVMSLDLFPTFDLMWHY
jgi:hypothetical protein